MSGERSVPRDSRMRIYFDFYGHRSEKRDRRLQAAFITEEKALDYLVKFAKPIIETVVPNGDMLEVRLWTRATVDGMYALRDPNEDALYVRYMWYASHVRKIETPFQNKPEWGEFSP